MATIKSFTSLEQSRKLAKILPIDSADMSWVCNGLGKPFARTIPIKGDPEELCACWSLAALLGVLPNYQLQTQDDGIGILCSCNGEFNIVTANNPIDACYEMVLKLHELNLL